MYRPTRKGEPNNDAYLEKAIANYKLGSEKANTPIVKQRSLQYLVNAYGPEKLNDPTQAEPVVKAMIDLEPNEPTNYFVLADIYADSGEYELAEQTYLKAKEVRPNDPAVYMQLAGFYNSQGDFDKTIAAVNDRTKVEPNNPEAYQTLATYYWDKAYRDFRLNDKEKLQYVLSGLEAVDKAIEIKTRLHGSGRLQEPAAPPPGEPREGSGQAAGAAARSRPAARQGRSAAQAEGRRAPQ